MTSSDSSELSRFSAVVIDAGVGNLGNLERALRAQGAEVRRTSDPSVVRSARCLLLPGVGAFRPPREVLRGALEEALAEALAEGAFLLGICIGYQLLFEASEEFGETDGLGLIPGRIVQLPETVSLPHIGWNQLRQVKHHDLLKGVTEKSYTYFVHSFAAEQTPQESILASCRHGREFPAVVGRGRVFGTQFHPEKSGDVGQRILLNFLEMSHGTPSGD